jgi:hypothetical protein
MASIQLEVVVASIQLDVAVAAMSEAAQLRETHPCNTLIFTKK